MQNIYGNPGKGVITKTVCGISDDDADDYENVDDNRKVPAIPERKEKGNKTTGRIGDLQLRDMEKPSFAVDKAENTTHGPRRVPSFQPPPIGLDFSSPAVNAAFRDQTVEQTSEKKLKWDWKNMVVIFGLVLMFLLWILVISIMFIYYSNISNQLTELKINVSQIQDISMEDRETWKKDLMKVNQTLMNEIAVLKSDVQSIMRVSDLCSSCPLAWTLLDSKCYFFSTSHQSWENSRKECNKMASSLLILRSQKEQDALRPLTGNKRFWIGLRRNINTWLWVDGKSPIYTNWHQGEPNNAAQREHCTEMISGGWNDLDCGNTIDYICEKTPSC
ncbi:CD209 antigen-like protein E isoform X2 [Dendropsophus ebraccatus]|uniref:CD209 antigen-like protein E isoform X2 n=1 Tax=Dendropsophus ebraccatus TaxID=150705 RepID=UPI0038315B4B